MAATAPARSGGAWERSFADPCVTSSSFLPGWVRHARSLFPIRGLESALIRYIDVVSTEPSNLEKGRNPLEQRQQQQQQHAVNQASQEWVEAAMRSFQTLADRTLQLQEGNLRLTRDLFQQLVEQLQSQTQGNRQAAQALQVQGERQQQAFRRLAQESASAYSEFLNSALSFYQQALRQATQIAQTNLQTLGQVSQQSVQGANQAARQTAEAGNRAASQKNPQATSQLAEQNAQAATKALEQTEEATDQAFRQAKQAESGQGRNAGPPIEDYERLSIADISEKLDELSAEDLEKLREFEKQNRNRDALMERIERKIRAAS